MIEGIPLTDSQLRAIATYTQALIRAQSKSVGEVIVEDTLENLTSLPAIKQTGNVATVVRVPIELLAKPAKDAADNLGETVKKAENAAELATATAREVTETITGLDDIIHTANQAATNATNAAEAAGDAAELAGHLPRIIDGYWHFYDKETEIYINSGTKANGNINYATFEIDPETTELKMTTPELYDGVTFYINQNDELILKIN